MLSITSEFDRSNIASKERRITFQNKRQKSIFMTFENLYESKNSKTGDTDSYFKYLLLGLNLGITLHLQTVQAGLQSGTR